MEEIKYKLDNGRPSVVGSALARLTDIIVTKFNTPGNETGKETSITDKKVENASSPAKKVQAGKTDLHQTAQEELEILWSSCKCEHASTAVMAVDFLLHLNTLGYLDPSSTLSNLMATSSQFKCTDALVNAIGRLLTNDFLKECAQEEITKPQSDEQNERKGCNNKSTLTKRFGIESNQHPFISLLRASPATNWPHILNIVRYFLESQEYKENEMCNFIRPVFLFVLCNPHENPNLAALRNEFRNLLIKHHTNLVDIVRLVMEWTKYEDSHTAFVEYVQFSLSVFQVQQITLDKEDDEKAKSLAVRYAKQLPFLLSLSCHAVQLGVSINHLLGEIKSRIDLIFKLPNIKEKDDSENEGQKIKTVIQYLNIAIIVLSKLLEISPHIYLDKICTCALTLINFEIVHRSKTFIVGQWQVGIFVSSLLQMMSFSSTVTSKKLLKGGGPQILLTYRKRQTHNENVNLDAEESDVDINVDGEWDRTVKWSKYINRLLNKLKKEQNGCNDVVVTWLKQINEFESNTSLQTLFPVFSTILLSIDKTDNYINYDEPEIRVEKRLLIQQLTLSQMLRSVKHQPILFASQFLTLILYKLSYLSQNGNRSLSMLEFKGNNSFLQLLSCLPHLAVDRGCISSVLQIIQSLEAKPKLVALQLKLLLELWRVENRCYPCLQKSLEKKYTDDPSSSLSAEISLSKARVIKQILKSHAHNYGADLLRILSDILNQCCSDTNELTDDAKGSTFIAAANTAMEGIILLCQEGVIDIATTVTVLSPKLKRDPRPEILAKFTELLAIAPMFKLETQEYEEFVKETLSYLWTIAFKPFDKSLSSGATSLQAQSNQDQSTNNQTVKTASIRAIAKFDLESNHLKMMPSYVKERLKLPAAYCSTPMDAARKPEDVLSYMPGEAWTELLLCCDSKEDLDNFEYLVCSMVKKEVANLPKLCYNVANKWSQNHHGDEPPNFNYLPEKSILRAIISNLFGLQMNLKPLHASENDNLDDRKILNTSHKKQVHESFLRILSAQNSRPLPPFDWLTFKPWLQCNAKGKTHLIFPILINQASMSNSARLFIESILSSSSAVREVVNDVFSNLLKILVTFLSSTKSSSLRNNTCEIFILDAIQMWTASALRDTAATKTYLHILKCCKEALKTNEYNNLPSDQNDLDITPLDCAKDIIGSALESINDQLIQASMNPSANGSDVDVEVLYDAYMDAVAEMTTSKLEKLISPAMWWNLTDVNMFQAIAIRTRLACSGQTETPMVWLNECIDVLAKREYKNNSNTDEIGAITFDNLLRSLGTIAAKTHVTKAQSHRNWLLELMGQVRSFVRFSSKPDTTKAEASEAATDSNSNTAGGFHLLFDIFALSIIIYSEVYGIIAPERCFPAETDGKDGWYVSLANDMSLNSRWMKRLDLLPLAIQSIVCNEECISNDKKEVSKNMQNLASQLSEWFLQLLHAINGNKTGAEVYGLSNEHVKTMMKCLSAFKGAEQYKEASMWGRLLTAYCL